MATGCAGYPDEESVDVTGAAFALINDQSHGAGRPGFSFLPPIATREPEPDDAFESRLSPTVQIDQLNAAGQSERTVAKYGDQRSADDRVWRNSYDEYYYVRFASWRFGLDAAKTYRIRVSVADQELGFADIDVVSRSHQTRAVDRSQFVPLVNGATLMIKFRIEKRAVDRDGDGIFDWLDTLPIREVSAGLLHTCAITTRGELYCWGDDQSGQLGDGDGDSTQRKRNTPARIGSDSDWTSVAAGSNHTCGLRGAGELYCWGSNALGQVGDGTKIDRETPVRVGSSSDWSSLTAGSRHGCGLRNGELYCWGANGEGQLGNNMTVSSAVPTRIGAANNWSFVGAGANHTCGGRAGQLYCWGANSYGALGDGTTSARISPTRVGAASDWTSVSAGSYHSCGLRGAGALYCWGMNDEGEVGDGSTTKRLTPVLVGNRSWEVVDSGAFHNCAQRAGALYCWGLNSDGALGDATHENRLLPTRVGVAKNYDAVSVGGFHSCALRDERLYCWGQNFYGELGDGSFVERTTAVLVTF